MYNIVYNLNLNLNITIFSFKLFKPIITYYFQQMSEFYLELFRLIINEKRK